MDWLVAFSPARDLLLEEFGLPPNTYMQTNVIEPLLERDRRRPPGDIDLIIIPAPNRAIAIQVKRVRVVAETTHRDSTPGRQLGNITKLIEQANGSRGDRFSCELRAGPCGMLRSRPRRVQLYCAGSESRCFPQDLPLNERSASRIPMLASFSSRSSSRLEQASRQSGHGGSLHRQAGRRAGSVARPHSLASGNSLRTIRLVERRASLADSRSTTHSGLASQNQLLGAGKVQAKVLSV